LTGGGTIILDGRDRDRLLYRGPGSRSRFLEQKKS
jgi:hypothetical protein